jgi:hypothetical protein
VRVADEPLGEELVLTRHGELIIAGTGREPVALADYLASLNLSAAGGAGAV